MEPISQFYLRQQGKAVGPFTAEHLRELAVSGAVSPATEAAPGSDGPWVELGTLPVSQLVFRQERQFEKTNTNASPPIALSDLIAAAQSRIPPRTGGATAAPAKAVSAEHDVGALLEFNHAIEKRRGLFTLTEHRPRKSKRTRDYIVLLTGVGALFFMVLVAEAILAVSLQTLAADMPGQFWPILNAVLFHSPILAWGAAMFAFYATALTWLMFGLMDDY